MPISNLIEYSNNHSQASGSLWQYDRKYPNVNKVKFESVKFTIRITWTTPAAGNKKDFKILVPVKYLSNFWKTHEMPLINC